MRREVADVAAVELDAACGRIVEAEDRVEQGGLAGAVRTDESDDLALVDVEGGVVHGGQPTETDGDVVRLDQRRAL